MCWPHMYLWFFMPAGQPRLQGKTIELMVCSSDRTLGLLNLAVGADSNGFLGTHTHTQGSVQWLNRRKWARSLAIKGWQRVRG